MSGTEVRIRVLRIIARMNVGGPAIQVFGIMNELDKKFFDQQLIVGNCEEYEIDYLTSKQINFPIHKITGLGRSINLLDDLRAFLEIRKIIKEFRPHIIHTHTAKAGFLGRVASISLIKRQIRVHTYHGHLLHGYFSPLKTKLVVVIERILSYFTTVLIAVGIRVKVDLINKGIGSESKFQVINPGLKLNLSEKRSTARSKLEIDDKTFYVAWVGRLTDIKKPKRILEIALEVSKYSRNVQFLVAGGGELLDELREESIVEKLPVRFIGWTENVEDLLRESKILILTSENEGTPMSIIQAQLMGLPVIATDVGSVNEVLENGKSGFVLPYNPTKFAEAIINFKTDRHLYISFSDAAKNFAEGKFTTTRLVIDHEELYLRLISKHQANFVPKAQA